MERCSKSGSDRDPGHPARVTGWLRIAAWADEVIRGPAEHPSGVAGITVASAL